MSNEVSAAYQGPDRRRRRVYVTRNHEYHCKDGVCVAVRDVRTGAFLRKHGAIGKQASAAVRMRDGGIEAISMPDQAQPGERMHFASGVDDPRDVLTSPITAVDRPPKDVVAQYDRLS
jgi:hypothetical protein